MGHEPFDDDEWSTLQSAPFWVVLAAREKPIRDYAGGAAEVMKDGKSAIEAASSHDELTKQVIDSVMGDEVGLRALMLSLAFDSRTPQEGLRATADIIERRTDSERGEQFKQGMLTIARRMAGESKRGLFGRKSPAEKKLARIAADLRAASD